MKDAKKTCPVCPHACRLAENEIGKCSARAVLKGKNVSVNYCWVTALALDPIEKKPLARFFPGSSILSYGSYGCNLACSFCQNWEISLKHGDIDALPMAPDELVRQAVVLKNWGNIGIAFTYNEPLICYDYILDVAPLAHEQGLKLVIVTNGYVMPKIAEQVFAQVDAANIDLKAYTQDFYDLVGAPAGLATVKRSIEIALAAACHVELTTLVIPGLNDSPEEMADEAAWIASLSPDIPLHISRFHPAYKMLDRSPTPKATILALESIAKEHLNYVYTGNM